MDIGKGVLGMIRRRCVLLGILVLLAFGSIDILPGKAGASPCPNESLRNGASTALSDCRAYELVTPADTNGRMLESISYFTLGRAFDLFPTELASPMRDSFVYETFAGALPAPAGASGIFDMYEAERSEDGWQTTKHLSRPATSLLWPLPGGISVDHSYSFQDEGNTSVFNETHLRSPDGSYEPIGIGSLGTEPRAQGRYISEGGGHIIFSTGTQESQSAWCQIGCAVRRLEPDAAPTGTGAIYDRVPGGSTHVISLLPGNQPAAAGEEAMYQGTSKDGSAVAFTIGGVLFARIANAESLEVVPGNVAFGGLSDDGRYLFYVRAGTIHRFDTTIKTDIEVNPVGEGAIVNVSADGSHVYFISEQQLDGSKGSAGQPNMYVWSGTAPEYVTTVVSSDLVQTSGHLNGLPALTNWTEGVLRPLTGQEAGPGADSSRTTPDGTVVVFESKAQLTALDNNGHTEIYRYHVGDMGPQCVSCNPLAPTVSGDARLQEVDAVAPPFIIHNLSDDGSRVFFETPEALVQEDNNGVNDVYEWEQGEGGPSVRLISSGHSPGYPLPEGWVSNYFPIPNLLLAATPSGNDVFFGAKEALVAGAGEGGTQGIYDARVDGGFAVPPARQACQEDECRPVTAGAAPTFLTPQSEVTAGGGNLKPRKRRCRRGLNVSPQKRAHRCRGHHHHKKKAVASSAPAAKSETKEAVTFQIPPPPTGGPVAPPPKTRQVVAASSSTVNEEFKIERFDAALSPPDAGMHPDFTTTLEFSHFLEEGNPAHDTASASTETIAFRLPPGLIGNPNAVPTCDTGDFVSLGNCPTDSQVGITTLKLGFPEYTSALEPIYNLTPPHPSTEVARLGFIAYFFPVFIDVKVGTARDYEVTATVHNAPGLGALIRAKATLWGNPASSSHDDIRLTPIEAANCENPASCKVPGGRPSTIPVADRRAFMTNPSACQEGAIGVEATTYQHPGDVLSAASALAPIVNCQGLPFSPSLGDESTNHTAGAPTGLKAVLKIPQHLGPEEKGTATMREARVTLPEGIQIAAGAANWIGTCSEAEVGFHEEVDGGCPDNSKLGTVTILSPALSKPIEGELYQRTPAPGHQFGLWLVADALGLHVKLPGEIKPDKTTGRLTAVFSDLPQVPVEEIDLNVWGGHRAPLQNPDHCGTYTTDFSFAPHSMDAVVSGQSQMQIDEGCGQGFSPTLNAGVTDPQAGRFSTFVFGLNRDDGQQAMRGFALHLPEGELAKIKGVPLCSETDAASGNCPAGSRIGSLKAAAGPGPEPLWVPQPGKPEPAIYLAGPYQGAPYSVVSEVPAQAGPFDLGTLAVRSGLQIDPETGQATVKADPLPQFFEGVGIAYRHLHAVIDRPEFSLNPTDCREMAVAADVTSTLGTVAHPSARFQLSGCKALKFKPKLSLKLRGGSKRGDYPALTATLKARKGDANIAKATVGLPHSEFLAQEHLITICTRKQFTADKCPNGSIYGKAKAWTPLLDKPLEGAVYLRSSDHPLPDMVVALRGQIQIDLVGRIDSHKGGLRTTFEQVPDAPVSRFILQMKGGSKGLLVNSTDICQGKHRVAVQLRAQNGRVRNSRPSLASTGCGKPGQHHKRNR